MNFDRFYKFSRYLPDSLRRLGRTLINYYRDFRGYPLSGVLDGYRMRGKFYENYVGKDYEPEVVHLVTKIVQPGSVCIDIGSHVGYFTLLFAKLVGEHGRVIAFEAHPENAKYLLSNVKSNGFRKRVKVENMAVLDDKQQSVKLFPGRKYSSFEWNIVGHDVRGNSTQSELEVPAISLDAYFSTGLTGLKVDFVKMDIEGAEARALRGMKALLQHSQPLMLIEFHDKDGWIGRHELFAVGYSLYDIQDNRWLDSERDSERVYQCLAIPQERLYEVSFLTA